MSRHDCVELCEDVCRFLGECGGIYENITPETFSNLMHCIVSNQYVFEDGVYFAGYWLVHQQDLEQIKTFQRPQDIYTGELVYILEAGCKRDIMTMINGLHTKNPTAQIAFWHRGNTLKSFRLIKKGARYGS